MPIVFAALGAVVIAAILLLLGVSQAIAGQEDASTLGIGDSQAYSDGERLSAADRASGDDAESESDSDSLGVSETVSLTDSSQRSISVKDPDPVIVPVAIDTTNPEAITKASEVCTLDPLPTAPRVSPDVDDGTWSSGVASAYDVASNDDGNGNFGVNVTASGVDLTDTSVTVAVPASQSYLLGSVVEICYEGEVVIATVTDTGGFGKYGRDLDLAPGVYKAFGFSDPSEWGTRTVYYRFL